MYACKFISCLSMRFHWALCSLLMSNIFVLSDFVLVGHFKCWRGCFNRTWHSLFPAICKLENFHSVPFHCLFGFLAPYLFYFMICSFSLGVQGQECGCSACEKSWKGWIQSHCPHSWYPKTRTQRSWYQE